jgi:ADP-ribosylglycohydrolase
MTPAERGTGCLVGTALGDSLLLPSEGLSRARVARRFPGPVRQRLVCGHGLVSDDTEHAFLTAQALLAAGDDADRFARALASRLRWWLLALPGGCGLATARALLRSWIGFPPGRSGVASAGNGPAMRAAIIGLRWAHDADRRQAFLRASTLLTHTDPRALHTAAAVAEAAAVVATGGSREALWTAWRGIAADPTWQELVALLEEHDRRAAPVDAVARALGCPEYVSGFALHSIPLALYAWLRHRQDPEGCLAALQTCGGDTDTMGAIAGALLGADLGAERFPIRWRKSLPEWPLSVAVLRRAGNALAEPSAAPVSWCWPLQPARNLVFLLVVLGHGFRRLW